MILEIIKKILGIKKEKPVVELIVVKEAPATKEAVKKAKKKSAKKVAKKPTKKKKSE